MAILWQLLGDFMAILRPFFQRLARSEYDVNTKHDSTISRLMLTVKERAKPVVERATRIVKT